MKNTKFHLTSSSIVLIFVPVALFLYRYLQLNSISSLFAIEFLFKIGATAILAVVGVGFVFWIGSIAPYLFGGSDNKEPDAQTWVIFGGVLLAMFVMLLWSTPLKKDTQYETVDNRSYCVFSDGKNVIHYDPYCPQAHYANNERQAFLYEPFSYWSWDYGVCDHCAWVYYDVYEDIVHESPDCVALTIKKHDDLERSSITDMFDQGVELCPYCY